MDNSLSAADIMAMTGNNQSEMWNNPFIYLVWLAVLGRGGLFGRGNGDAAVQGALTRADLFEGFNNNQVDNGIRNLSNGLCDGFYAINTSLMNGFSGVQNSLCNGFNGVNSGIANLGYQMQSCCCETNRNIDASRYEAAKNTCDITNAIHAEGEATRALINANTVQELRDRLEDRDRQLLTANFQISQQAQSASLVNELRPCARPAYITCSPYTSFCPPCHAAPYTGTSQC